MLQMSVNIHVAPWSYPEMDDAIRAGGGKITDLAEADGLVWLDWANPELFPSALPGRVRWVQLPSAGIEQWVSKLDVDRSWTSASAAFSRPVAEHALSLMLAGTRRLHEFARSTTWTRSVVSGLAGSSVAVIGTGGIGRALTRLLDPFDCEIFAVTRRGRDGTLPIDRVGEVWPKADFVVIAAPETPATRGLVGADAFAAMRATAWLINVSRGSLVETAALIDALDSGAIAGAALDVTDPEPLPDGHPLWKHPKALITPHIANPHETMRRNIAGLVKENTARLSAGEPLISVIDVEAGY